MRFSKIVFVFLISAFACEGPLGFDDPIPIDGGGGDVPDRPIGGGGTNPPPPPPPPPPTVPTAQEYYNAGYGIGTSDADWLVAQTWQEGKCVVSSFKQTDYFVEINGQIGIITNKLKLERKLSDCPITTQAQRLAFDNFISVYSHQTGYIQILEDRVNSSIGDTRAFYEGILAGFKNRLCGWSITMPFNFVYCDAIDLPGSTTMLGGPSGGGATVCPSCPS